MSEGKIDIAKTMVRGSVARLAAGLGASAMAFAFSFLVLRVLPPEQAGIFFISMSALGFMSIFPNLGIPDVIGRFVPYFLGEGKTKKIKPFVRVFLKTTVAASIATSVLMILFSGYIQKFYGKPLRDEITIVAFILPLSLLHPLLDNFLRGFNLFVGTSIIEFLRASSKLVFLVLAVYLVSASAESALIAVLGSFLVSVGLLGAWSYIKLRDYPESGVSRQDIKEGFLFGFPIYLAGMSVVVNSWTDTLFLGYFFPAAVVAGYNSVLLISRSVPMVIGSSLSAIQQPVLSYLSGRKSDLFKNVAQNTVKWNFYLSLPALSFILLFSAQIMGLVFPEYKDAYHLIYILAPSFFIVLLSAPFKYALMAIGRTDIALKISLFMILINLLLNAVLIPSFGMAGAAVATGLSFLINEALFMCYGKKLAGVWLHPEMRKALLSMALSSAIVQALKQVLPTNLPGLIIHGAILVSVYVALLVALKSFNETDKEVFRAVVAKLNLSRVS